MSDVKIEVEVKMCPLIIAGAAGARYFQSEYAEMAQAMLCHKAACALWDDDRKCCGLMTYVPKSKEGDNE